MDVRKTVTDAGYVAIGLGLMGVQQAQARRRALTARLRGSGGCVADRGRDIERRAAAARDLAEERVRTTVSRVQELGSEIGSRVEPIVEQVQAQVAQLPERVVQALEPVTTRVRERLGTAAA